MLDYETLSEIEKARVEKPILNPFYRFYKLNNNYFIESVFGINNIDSPIICKILRQINGKKTIADLVKLCGESEIIIKTNLIRLCRLGYIFSNNHNLSAKFVNYWVNFHISPLRAQELLNTTKIAPHFLSKRISLKPLTDLGFQWQKSCDDADIILIFTHDFLHDDLSQLMQKYRQAGKQTILINHYDSVFKMGPLFNPIGESGCYECLKIRMESHQEVKYFIKNTKTKLINQTKLGLAPNSHEFTHYIASFLGQYIMNNKPTLRHNLITRYIADENFQFHEFRCRPQCPNCGQISQEIQPITIESAPKIFSSSGGFRKISPFETFEKYKYLISPYTGIIRYLKPEFNLNNGYFFVYSSGQNQALRSKHFITMRDSIRAQTFGKGTTELDAKVSSMCEALERSSAVFIGDEIRATKKMTDFKENQAIHPNDVMLFSDWQFENREFLNNLGCRFLYVPHQFRPDENLEWSPIWSMNENRWKYLPTNYLYFTYPINSEAELTSTPDSNGMASGSCFEDAIVQGFYELIERDSFALWWYNKLSIPELDLESFDNPFLYNAQKEYAKFNRAVWLLDLTADFGIPAFVALSRRTDKVKQDILIGAGAHENPEIAAIRALAECNQSLPGYHLFTDNEADYRGIDLELRNWFFHVNCENNSYLQPNENLPKSTKNSYKFTHRPDFKDDIEHFTQILKAKNLELLVKDMTRPDIKMPVAQVKVPGLRHFWSRLANGRLYNVPVAMGKLSEPTHPSQVNPIPVFI